MSKRFVMGLFPKEALAAKAAAALSRHSWAVENAYSPIPSETLSSALKVKKSPVGYFTLAGGIFGLISGFALAIFASTRWNLIVSGKPVVALIPFFIVGFEFTILFAVFGNIIGMLSLTRLPTLKRDPFHDERLSEDHFGILASCPEGEEELLAGFFREHGGEVRRYDG